MIPVKRLTRRQLLQQIGLVGGGDAVYHTLYAMGLAGESGFQRPLQLEGRGNGRRVLILGAGLAGLAAAYELSRLGYDCQVLEPRRRSGGRTWTVRQGDEVTEVGRRRQVCRFDEGLFYNPGPARIPHHHRAILHYCKQFGVELDVVINYNRGAYLYHQGERPLANRPVVQRRAVADMHGYTAELLAKAVSQNALDDELTAADQERMIDFLKVYGDLSEDLLYRGSSRAGYTTPPGAGLQAGDGVDPYNFSTLLHSRLWRYFGTVWSYQQQMTMLAPVHGMDMISRAFEQHVGPLIRFRSEVRAIRRTPQGVRVLFHDLDSGQMHEAVADFCICTIPLTVLSYIPGDYPAGMKNAIDNVSYATATRVGLQFGRRFWEEDENIYGGISWTNQIIQQILYPFAGLQTQKGVLLAAYPFGTNSFELSSLQPAEVLQRTLAELAAIHPQAPDDYETGVTVTWHLIHYNLGCFAAYSDLARENFYPLLQQTDGHIYLAGEHMSYLTGWQEGAILSALEVVEKVHERALAGQALSGQTAQGDSWPA
jgi:monoamine oxidase